MDTTTFDEHLLSDLKPGQSACVKRIDMSGEALWRLMDLGLVPGTRVEAVYRGPFGQPVAYRVRGALIAMRKDQSGRIVVEFDQQHSQERE